MSHGTDGASVGRDRYQCSAFMSNVCRVYVRAPSIYRDRDTRMRRKHVFRPVNAAFAQRTRENRIQQLVAAFISFTLLSLIAFVLLCLALPLPPPPLLLSVSPYELVSDVRSLTHSQASGRNQNEQQLSSKNSVNKFFNIFVSCACVCV